MADENWQQIRKIFDDALRRKAEERPNFIRQQCGEDKVLLREVESLLSALDGADSFLETPAVAKVADVIETETKRLERGTRFGHYEIIEQIGTGGMGEVYLAKDKKLDRRVAVKILNEKFARHESNLQRFISEAKAASALNHPNILTIYEFGESDRAHYIVSEFVKGKTLRETLRQSSLKLSEILDISIQIAGALSAAHEARLIHRDVKPENIMIRPDGYVKVLDFGLAKLVEQKNKSILGLEESTIKQNQTAKGVILGTVNYMSPEQAKGERVDERTDIFSLGTLVYEMITGKTPFAGESVSETFANLINTEPQPLSRFAANVPDELERIVSKTLRKKKDERYQTMRDLLTDLKELKENLTLDEKLERFALRGDLETRILRAITGDARQRTAKIQNNLSEQIKRHKPLAAFVFIALLLGFGALSYYLLMTGKSAGDKKSIAVLPIKPINTANRDEIYEFGIAESLINRLSLMKGFRVRPLSATRQYADVSQDPIVAGREQQVDYVLASNYQLADGKIRLTAQLIDVASGQIEEPYKIEKDVANLFAMQDAIAGEIGNRLLARFATTSSSPTARRGTINEEAYSVYLHGRNLTYNRNPPDAPRKAIEYFEQAVRLDPNFARAYSGMAHAYIASGNHGVGLAREEYEKARTMVNKALELDGNLAEGYAVLGELQFVYEWNYPAAEKNLLRAIELDPNSDLAHSEYASFLASQQRFDEAFTELKTALEINPSSFEIQQHNGRILYLARRYDEAILQFKRLFETTGKVNQWIWLVYEMKGDTAGAYEWLIKFYELNQPEKVELFQNAYKTSGWRGVREKLFELQRLSEEKPSGNYYLLARNCARLGEKEQAFKYLNTAIEKRQGQIPMLNVEPSFDILRDDPRFDEMLKRTGFK